MNILLSKRIISPKSFLIAAPLFLLALFVVFGPSAQVYASPESECGTKLKATFKPPDTVSSRELRVCVEAYNIVVTFKPHSDSAAQEFCDAFGGSSGRLEHIACLQGQILGAKASRSGTTGGGSTSLTPTQTGTAGAKAGDTKSESCDKYHVAASKTACEKAYDATKKSSPSLTPTQTGTAGAKAGDTKSESCDKYHVAASKTACEEAYDAEKKSNPTASGVDPAIECKDDKCDLIGKYVNPVINVLSVSFGLIAIISLILGSINYATSEGDPQKASKAKQRIVNTLFAVIAYLFLYSFLEFLVPGGFFNR